MPGVTGVREEEKQRGDTSGLVRHSVYNLLGQMLPMLVAAVSIPVVVSGLGVERFALLSLAWAILAYVAVFDLGIGRATTHLIARIRPEEQPDGRGAILRNAIVADLLIGVLLALLLQPLVPLLPSFLKVPAAMTDEALSMLRIVSYSVPVLTLGGTLRAALEGEKRFAFVNAVKGPFNALLFLIPMLGVFLDMGLGEIMLWIIVSRAGLVIAYAVPLLSRYPDIFSQGPSSATLKTLFSYGGWVTVSNTLTPLVAFGERLIIPALLSVGVLAYYTAPYEMISRLAVIPFSITLASFPRISEAFGEERRDAWGPLVIDPMIMLHGIITPLVALVLTFSDEIILVWLGPTFAGESADLLRLLALAFFANGFAYVLLAAVQGMGRPDLKAKLDIAESVVFFPLCAAGILWIGLEGAALAKVLIFAVDASVLYLFARSFTSRSERERVGVSPARTWTLSGIFLLLSGAIGLYGLELPVKSGLFLVLGIAFVMLFFRIHRHSHVVIWFRQALATRWNRYLKGGQN